MKKFLITLALLLGTVVSVAQTSDLKKQELKNGLECYLYSVGHGLFVNGAGAWNTQAIMSHVPLKAQLEQNGEKWRIKVIGTTVSGKTINGYMKREKAAGADMVFVDGKASNDIDWIVTPCGENNYTLSDTNGKYLAVSNTITNTQTNSAVYGPYFNQEYSDNDAQWAFVSTDATSTSLISNLVAKSSLNASKDLTFLMQSPECSNISGWAVDGDLPTDLLKVKNSSDVKITNLDGSCIEYWKGGNNSSKSGRVYYRLSSMPAGTYRLTAKVFNKSVNASSDAQPTMFFGNTMINFTNYDTDHTQEYVVYAQTTSTGDLDFGFQLPVGTMWVGVDNIKLETVGGANELLWDIAGDNVKADCNVIADETCINLNIVEAATGFNNSVRQFTASTLSYNRVLVPKQPTTVCLPFALSNTETSSLGKFYSLSDLDNGTLLFKEVSATEANKPYLFIPEVETFAEYSDKVVATTPSDLSEEASGISMTGSLKRTALRSDSEHTLYAYNNGSFVKISSSADAYLPAFRAYISVPAGNDAPSKLNVNLSSETTGITSISGHNVADAVYTIDGCKVVNPARKGLYISNGKKKIFK